MAYCACAGGVRLRRRHASAARSHQRRRRQAAVAVSAAMVCLGLGARGGPRAPGDSAGRIAAAGAAESGQRGNRGARAQAARPARRDRCAVACSRLHGRACYGTSARGRSTGFARLSTGGAASRRGVSDGLPASVARRRGDRNSHTRGRRLAHARAPNSTRVPHAASSSRTIRRRCNAPPPARPRGNFWHLRASPWRACSPHRMDSRCGFATCASPQPRSGKPALSPSSI